MKTYNTKLLHFKILFTLYIGRKGEGYVYVICDCAP